MSEMKLEARGLGKVYRNGAQELRVLKGIALKVRHKEFVAIQGPSGAGKSTLLHILGGLDRPTHGEVFIDGINLYGLAENERAEVRNRQIGFIFQFYHLLPELSALENVLLPALINSWWDRQRARSQAKVILEKVGLAQRLTHRPSQLSGGEQQRVAIARALINKPAVLLCDEPTGNLDSENGAQTLELLRRINKEEQATLILVTHDKDIAKSADRVVSMKDGIIVNPA